MTEEEHGIKYIIIRTNAVYDAHDSYGIRSSENKTSYQQPKFGNFSLDFVHYCTLCGD